MWSRMIGEKECETKKVEINKTSTCLCVKNQFVRNIWKSQGNPNIYNGKKQVTYNFYEISWDYLYEISESEGSTHDLQ